jgi:HAD superfamily hydrolase (TIGR01549 family)
MSDEPPSFTGLDEILAHARHLLIDFDGTLCSLFAGTSTTHIADRLRKAATREGAPLPPSIVGTHDWFAILAYAFSADPDLGVRVADELTELESAAVATAVPVGYAHDVVTACRESGRSVAVISNNSEPAVRAYLAAHDLDRQITVVAARTGPDPATLKPSPYLIERAASLLGTDSTACVVIGDQARDIEAARAAGARSIGYAATRDAAVHLSDAGADTIITTMAQLTLRLRAR